LEESAGIIQNELTSVLSKEAQTFNGDSALQTRVMGSGWSALRLQRMGQWNDANVARFPMTVALIKNLCIPTAIRGVMFARQRPSSSVAPHSDGRNFVLTAHLGLMGCSDKCWIEVAGKRKNWETGKVVVLDTSFVHETSNSGDMDRYVLIIDFWHPELTQAERDALKFIYDLRYEYDRNLINNSNR